VTRAELGDTLALVNAILNGTCALLIVAGRVAVARKLVTTHRGLMLAAFATSCAFLVSYLTRVALTGAHVDPHRGWVHVLYLSVLFSHMVLAMVVVPLVLSALWLAYRRRFQAHKRVARVTFPVWLYVSVTGVVVYVMLYHVPA